MTAQERQTDTVSTDSPAVSVVIVSDYASNAEAGWEQLRRALRALAQQDFVEPAEFLWVENAALVERMPADIPALLPSLKILRSTGNHSFTLKNEGARAASAGLVAILDADCEPAPQWLRELCTVLRRHPEAAAVSGTVTYPNHTRLGRLLGLLDRTYLNRKRTGDTDSINNNSTGFRRSVLIDHPLPENNSPFFNKLYARRLLRMGYRVLFEPRMRATHDFEGWSMERDVRRNVGHATVAMRLADRTMPFAWAVRLRYAAIPFIVLGKTALSILTSTRFARAYDVAWYELPLAWLLAPVIHSLEIPGMIAAFRGQPITATAYR